MTSGRYILNYLNTKDEFWYWGINQIKINEFSLEFKASKHSKQHIYHIEVTPKGFVVKLFKLGTFRQKLIKHYKNIQPSDLTEIISNLVFPQKVAA